MDPDCFTLDHSASAHALCAVDLAKGASSEGEVSVTAAALPASEAEDLDSFSLIEPPPLDWKSDSSSETGSADVLDEPSVCPAAESPGLNSLGESLTPPLAVRDTLVQFDTKQQELLEKIAEVKCQEDNRAVKEAQTQGLGIRDDQEEMFTDAEEMVSEEEVGISERRPGDEDHRRIHSLLSQLQLMQNEPHPCPQTVPGPSEQEPCAPSLLAGDTTGTTGLLFSQSHHRDLLGLLQCTEVSSTPVPSCLPHRGEVDAVVSVSYSQEDAQTFWRHNGWRQRDDSIASLPDDEYPEPVWMKLGEEPPEDDSAAESEQVRAKTAQM